MSRRLVHAALVASIIAGPMAASAHDYTVGALKIVHPWARATPAGAPVAGAYLLVENAGAEPDRLVSAEVPDVAGRVEVHEMAVANGVMTMRPLPGGLAIGPGAKAELKPGGLHLMLMGLKRPLKAGERVKGTLTFERAGQVAVEFAVTPVGAPAPSGTHTGEHAH
jgi:copper(I)-binding protein